jgi:anti-sigma factor RsiW
VSGEHLGFEQMADLVEGRVAPAAHAALLEHLAGCGRCAANLAWLERTLSLTRADAAGPSEALSAQLRALFRQRGRLPARPAVPAQLHFDSGQGPRATGLRGAPAVERQLLYTAEALEVDLRLMPGRSDWAVSGQVLGPAERGMAELFGAPGAFRAELSELAEFVIAPVPAGRYLLTLSLADVDLMISDLELSSLDATH